MIVTMSSKGQIVVPKEIRKELKLEKGANFAVYAKEDTLVLKKVETLSALEMFDRLTKWGHALAKRKGWKEEEMMRKLYEGRRVRSK
jgi:AbrB family looped-hinge helix DNA binding protein